MSSPIYVGDNSISEIPGSKLKQKRGVADVLTRVFEGNASFVSAFIAANVIFQSKDYEYTYMLLDDREVTYDGPNAKIVQTYYGINFSIPGLNPNNLQQDAKFTCGSVRLETDNSADGEWNVNYRSPEITYRYTSTSVLNNPQYQGYSLNPSTVTLLDAAPAPPFIVPSGYVILGKWVYGIYSACTNFERHQKGEVFNYVESWGITVQNPSKKGATSISVGSVQDPNAN